MAASPVSSRSQVARDYFAEPRRYLRANYRIVRRAELVRDLLGDAKGLRVLDMGCGCGRVSAWLAPANDVTMIDSSPAMVRLAARHGSRAVVADALDYARGGHDVVLCIGLLAHVDDASAAIEAVARNLKPGGRAIVQFSDAARPVNRIATRLFRMRRRLRCGALDLQRTDGSAVLADAGRHGLRLVDQRDHLVILPGVPRLLGRWLVPYDRFVAARPRLARLGMDTLLLLQKDG